MPKKAIQDERMRGFFIQAAGEIIRAEGISAVSSRHVAERAGYSYATLYNYFKDIKELVFCCMDGFLEECRNFIREGSLSPVPDLGEISRLYAKFMIQYPGIFELLFLQKASEISTNIADFDKIDRFYASLTDRCWADIKAFHSLNDEDVARARLTHASAIHGLLMSYLNRRTAVTYESFMKMINDVTKQCCG